MVLPVPEYNMSKEHLRLTREDGDDGQVVGQDGVSSYGKEYPNMRQVGYRVGVRELPCMHAHT